MGTHRDQILHYLHVHPTEADDDRLASALGIPHRQAVNQLCRQMVKQGILVRQPDPVTRKIVNRLVDPVAEHPNVLTPSEPTEMAVNPAAPGRVVSLHGEAEMLQFAYAGEVRLTEDQVKEAVEAVLRTDGWTVDTRWGRAHGIDIEARRRTERLVLEAKGEGSRSAMRVNFFLGALGELLQRMESPDTRYGLALPAHRQFAGLILRLPGWVRARLGLCFFLVHPAPNGGYEVGLIRPGDEAHGL